MTWRAISARPYEAVCPFLSAAEGLLAAASAADCPSAGGSVRGDSRWVQAGSHSVQAPSVRTGSV
jgi:hypothetical protein